ncbi:MAG TPA: hypothetical protein VGO48_00800 [Conexibacter sp.]|nr:hypothetical protein [Conexibacter sp.]
MRSGVSFVLAGGLAFGLLQVLQTSLPSFHVRGPTQAIVAGIIGLFAALLSVDRARRDQRDAQATLETQLDDALACWPLRTPAELSPYDLGTHPTGVDSSGQPTPYVRRRSTEAAIAAALSDPGIVVVYGPARTGKSRTAFAVVTAECRDARLLVPEDAEGLRTLLAHAGSLADEAGERTVLWLDELPRFLPALELDAIDRLMRPSQQRRGWLARLLQQLQPPSNSDPDPSPAMKIVATLRDDELQALLNDAPADADADTVTAHYRLRRLLARGRAVPMRAPSADKQVVTTASALPAALPGWWQTRFPAQTEPPRQRGWGAFEFVLGLLVLAMFALGGLLVWYGHRFGLTDAPSTTDQIAKLVDDARDCEQLAIAPRGSPTLSSDDLLVVVAQREQCGEPDELRLYRRGRNDRLKRIAALSGPTEVSRTAFACVGATTDDRCHVTVQGKQVVIGAFTDVESYQSLPLALRLTDEGPRLTALAPEPPPTTTPGVIRAALRHNRKRIALHLRADGVGDRATASDCDVRAACLSAWRAEAWAAISSDDSQAPLLLAGYLAKGTTDAPRMLAVRAWRLSLRRDDGAATVRDECWIFAKGRQHILTVPVSSFRSASDDLAAGWSRAKRRVGGTTVC